MLVLISNNHRKWSNWTIITCSLVDNDEGRGWERKVVRWINGGIYAVNFWRPRIDGIIVDLYNEPSNNRIRWLGYVAPEWVKIEFQEFRWMEDQEEGDWEADHVPGGWMMFWMSVRFWKRNVQDREELWRRPDLSKSCSTVDDVCI